MKRYLITAAILAAVTPALGQSVPVGSTSMGTVATLPKTTKTCTITYEKGQVHTNDCDFSMPMTKARITPDSNKLTIEFEQQNYLSTTSGVIIRN